MKDEYVNDQQYQVVGAGRTSTTACRGIRSLILHPSSFILLCLPLLFLALFFCYPLAAVMRLAFAGGLGGVRELITDSYYAKVLWFTTWQATLSTALTLALALPAASAFARYDFPGKALLRAISSVPFVMPTVVVAAAFSALLGPRGMLNSLLQTALHLPQPPIQLQGTLLIVLLAHVFYNYTVVLRLVGGFWSNLDTRLEQAAAMLGANRWRVLWEVTLPLLTPALGAAALLVFIFSFTSFGVVVILGGPRFATIEVEVYRQTAQLLRLDIAAALSLVQLVCTLLMTLAYARLAACSTVPLDLRPRSATQRRPRTWGGWIVVGVNITVLLLLLGAPLVALALASFGGGNLTLDYYVALTRNRTGSIFYVSPVAAIRNSLVIAALTTLMALIVGGLAAYLLARRGRRTKNEGRKFDRADDKPQLVDSRASLFAFGSSSFVSLLDAFFMLPLGTSAVTLGLGFLVAFATPPLELRSSPLLIPIAHTLVAVPFVVRALLPVLRSLDPRLREAAMMLGAPPWRVLREIDLPILFPALLVGAVFAFTVSLGEFGATLLLARPEYPTLPIVIYRFLGQPGALNYGQALALSTVLMVTTAASFLLLERVRYRDVGEF